MTDIQLIALAFTAAAFVALFLAPKRFVRNLLFGFGLGAFFVIVAPFLVNLLLKMLGYDEKPVHAELVADIFFIAFVTAAALSLIREQ